MKDRPNILFLMSDEHRADVTGYEGNRVVQTPVLDELAKTGVVFRNAYAPSPICIPARQCLMAGQLPRTCGCEVYGEDLSPGYMTFARWFSQYAYNTVVCGKLHHMGIDQMQGWTQRIGNDTCVAPQFIQNKMEGEFEKYKAIGGKVKWSDAKEIQRAGIGCGVVHKKDDYTVQGALDCIERYFIDPYYDRQQSHLPLLLKVSLLAPHYPYMTDEKKFKYYLNRVEPFLNQPVSEHPFLSQRQVKPGVDVTERDIIRGTAAYYGMVEELDENFGKVLKALQDVGQDLDDWIIIYTSDHGEMLGEHGIWEKQKFYEASVRVPLIIRFPKKIEGGRVVNENVNLCDLFATLCELTGIPVPSGLDSRSLVPILKGDANHWNNETVSQFGRKNLMIKQDHLKYQYYGEDMPEVLFDLKKNPEETVDFMKDSEYAQVIAEFRNRRAQLGFGPDRNQDYVNAGYSK